MNKFACTLAGASIGTLTGAWAASRMPMLWLVLVALLVLILVICSSPVGQKVLATRNKRTTKSLPRQRSRTGSRKRATKA